MARQPQPWTKEQNDRYNARRAALREATDRRIFAALDAIDRGEDPVAKFAAEDAKAKPAAAAAAAATAAASEFAPLLELRKARADGWTIAMQRDFIRALADTGCVSHAAKAAGVARNTAYAMRQRATHSTFALAWDVAIQMGRKRLLDIAMERAIEGQAVAVWYRGEQVGTRTVHNDRLLTFLIAHTPAPAHPTLTPEELSALFPSMLDAIDTLLPHPFAERLAKVAAEAKADAEADGDGDDF